MSVWYQPKEKDIYLENGRDGEFVNIYLGSDYNGNIYVEVEIDILAKVLQTSKKYKVFKVKS